MKPLLFLSILFFPSIVAGQIRMVNQVASIGSIDASSNTLSMTSTIAEPVIGLVSSGGSILTQGFQQNLRALTTSTEHWPALDTQISVFPNPSDGHLQIVLDQQLSDFHFRVHDVYGQLIKVGQLQNASLDLTKIASGSYVLGLFSKGECAHFKIQIIK